ncbi:MAG: PAS domain S-box protein [Myxococcales bacterium]|nr:PAS domain S-box protein [Myxococcales bacterium]
MVVTDLGQHRRQHEELGVAERMARSILEQASEAIVVCDEDGRIIRASHAAHHLCGQSALWKLFDDVFHLRRGGSAPLLREPPPDEEDRFLLSPLLGSGRPLRTEVHFRRDDGKHFALLLSVGPMHELRGDVRGCVVTMADISERRRAEEELWRLTDSLEHRVSERTAELAAINRELEAFSYSVSHDLRAPLRAIEGFGRSLQEDCGDDLGEPGKSHLARMRAATRLMRDLIDDLLRLAQVTSGRLVRERVDLSALARTIAAALALAEPERTVRVAIADGLTAGGDLGLLRVALENLLGNAWKFTAQRPLAEVELGEMLTTEGKVFYVRDNGAGFDMKEADRLFAPFQRLHAPGEFSGTGVGLATVQRIIHRHGGRIWAEAAPRRGATFFFTL